MEVKKRKRRTKKEMEKANNLGGFSTNPISKPIDNIKEGGYTSEVSNVTPVEYAILEELIEIRKAITALHKNIIE